MDGCDRLIFRGLYCGGHYKRRQRAQALGPAINERVSPEERCIDAGDYCIQAPSDDDAEFKRRRTAWMRAMAVWMQSLGWVKPLKKKRRKKR